MRQLRAGILSRREELEAIVNMIGRQILDEMNDATTGPPVGFVFLCFDFGPKGFCAYVSNADPADLAKLLREHADAMEAQANPKGSG